MQKFVQIIPLKKLPRTLDFFDYSIPENIKNEIKIGQLFLIPFKNRETKGLVCGLNNKISTNKKILPVTRLIHENPYIKPENLAFILEMAEYYHSSPSLFLSLALPEKPKRRILSKQKEYFSQSKYKNTKTTELFARLVDDKYLMHYFEQKKYSGHTWKLLKKAPGRHLSCYQQ